MRFLTPIIVILGLLVPGTVQGKVVLNCEIADAPSKSRFIQILVDEDQDIVKFHFNLKIPISMKITFKNDEFILAHKSSATLDKDGRRTLSPSVFIISKTDGSFAYSFVTPVLISGNFIAFGNSLMGKCVRNPFDQ